MYEQPMAFGGMPHDTFLNAPFRPRRLCKNGPSRNKMDAETGLLRRRSLVGHIKPDLRLQIIDRVIFDNWHAKFE
jgi:hypothetical protein